MYSTSTVFLSRDTPVTPCTHPPVSTVFHYDLLQVLLQSAAICRSPPQSAIICRFCQILPSLLNSAEFRQNQDNARYSTVNLATKLTIYTPSSLFFTFFPYTMSWLHHTVHVLSLIISTLLYIIVACTYFVTGLITFKIIFCKTLSAILSLKGALI